MSPTLVLAPPQRDSTADWPERLMSDVPGLTVIRPGAEDAAAALRTADAAYGVLTDELLAATTRLRWLQAQQAAPPPDFYSPALIAHPLQLTNMRDTYTDHVAAHTLALVLAMCRGLPRYIRDQETTTWEPDWDPTSVTSLADSTALIVGIGAVGKEIGRLLHAFGCSVTGIDARPAAAPGFAAVLPVDELDQQLPEADLVVLTVPHTPDTEGMIDARRLKLLKSSAYFVNVGRGPTVQLDALTAALEAGQLGGAALDVFETEPLPPEHPLWSRPDVLITPHVAGAGPHEAERRYAVLLENCRRFVAGEELMNIVDKTKRF
ncbi:MAG TPA: D-2-hydroxyacid dehydrogenase [Kribbella sp.]|uniref:D-2-hydroxyacid dehydrogenase n=1 Tax=Kribbella sp. TaxID=1871183 RepID=UPI002D7A1AB6|nr:D-2-hydroxyacid dehydrogenase [Kribbella sp.]HET6296588.1 D-2-hydroxyacid dehydrogenase [Kribbella sp.]